MTNGNLFWKIIRFALPVMATTAMQLLYVTIDLATVHFGDSSEAMGAIASNNSLINLIIVVFTGVSLGVNVLLSEARGAQNKEKAGKILHTSLLFSLISGFAVGVIGLLFSDNLLVLMNTEAHYLEKATAYLRIYFSGLPFLMVYNYASQILRAQGDSKTPFIALIIAGAINVAFDCWFVFGFQLSVVGVGLATIIAEAISAAVCVLVIWKGKHLFVNIAWKQMRLDGKSLQEILRIGLPAGLQGFFFSLPNVFIQSNLYSIDPGNVNLENGAIASGNIESYFYVTVDSISTSVMTFIAANVGAKKPDNIKKTMLYGTIWGAICCVFVALIAGTLYRPLLSLFVDNDEAIEAGKQRLWIMAFFYLFNFSMAVTAGILKGIKKPIFPMATTMVFCTGLRILLIYTAFQLPEFHTLIWLYALFPITWVLATIVNGIVMAVILPKELRKLSSAQESAGE